jgi:hypothetical protein
MMKEFRFFGRMSLIMSVVLVRMMTWLNVQNCKQTKAEPRSFVISRCAIVGTSRNNKNGC